MTQKQKQRKKNFSFPAHLCSKTRVSINWRLFNRFLFAVIIVMIAAYIISVNDLSIQSFALSQAKSKVSEAHQEGERLNLEATNLGSYEAISRRAKEMKMVKVDKIDYIEIAGGEVAKR